MDLRGVVDAVMQAKGWSQTQLGEKLGATQSMVSRMRNGEDWAQHWEIFLKLLPHCVKLDLIGARELLGTTRHDREGTPSDPTESKAPHSPRRKRADVR